MIWGSPGSDEHPKTVGFDSLPRKLQLSGFASEDAKGAAEADFSEDLRQKVY